MKTRVGPLGDDDMMWHVLFVAECRRWARVRRLAAKSGRRRGSSRRWERMRRLHWIVLQEMYHYQSHHTFLKSLQRWEASQKKQRFWGGWFLFLCKSHGIYHKQTRSKFAAGSNRSLSAWRAFYGNCGDGLWCPNVAWSHRILSEKWRAGQLFPKTRGGTFEMYRDV